MNWWMISRWEENAAIFCQSDCFLTRSKEHWRCSGAAWLKHAKFLNVSLQQLQFDLAQVYQSNLISKMLIKHRGISGKAARKQSLTGNYRVHLATARLSGAYDRNLLRISSILWPAARALWHEARDSPCWSYHSRLFSISSKSGCACTAKFRLFESLLTVDWCVILLVCWLFVGVARTLCDGEQVGGGACCAGATCSARSFAGWFCWEGTSGCGDSIGCFARRVAYSRTRFVRLCCSCAQHHWSVASSSSSSSSLLYVVCIGRLFAHCSSTSTCYTNNSLCKPDDAIQLALLHSDWSTSLKASANFGFQVLNKMQRWKFLFKNEQSALFVLNLSN